ncbi:hypothetical protein AB0F46_41085 [Streptomyces sp. NPDC026665]|uniref:hypothetical protein n=1 Tax=Streptomyces sp. NPDC026665 TaxID=3154798 RepID=UPI0033E9AE64
MSDQLAAEEAGMLGALALAGHFFPRAGDDGRITAAFTDAAYFAHRKPQAWNAWGTCTPYEKRVTAQVMRLLPSDLAAPEKFKTAALAHLGAMDLDQEGADRSGGSFLIPGKDPFEAEGVIPRVGGDLLEYAASVTRRFFTFGKRPRALAFAGPGTYRTRTAYLGKEHGTTNREIEFARTPSFTQAAGHEALPQLTTRPHRDTLTVPVAELKEVTKLLRGRGKEFRYLHRVLKKFVAALKSHDEGPILELKTVSGLLQIINAPTGSGKTVLVRAMASWAAMNDIKIALGVTDAKSTLAMAWDINGDLTYLYEHGHLDEHTSCVPLMSPYSRHQRALDYASYATSALITEWTPKERADISHLAYGCGQRPLMEPSSLYRPGEENCLGLTRPGEEDKAYACPFIPVCGKFSPLYEAASASVIVTNHANLISGSLRIGAVLDGAEWRGEARGTRGLSVLEMVLRSCDLVVIDEVDAFQKTAISRCTSELNLASRKRESDLRDLDRDARRLPASYEHSLLNPVAQARLMSEFLLLSLGTRLRMNPRNVRDNPAGGGGNDGWRLARSRDRELLHVLFPGDIGDEEISKEMFHLLDTLMPGRWREDPPSSAAETTLPDGADWEAVQEALTALAAPRGEDYLQLVQQELNNLLRDAVPDSDQRAAAVNLLVTRTVLKEIDDALGRTRRTAQGLRHLDLGSVRRILESIKDSPVVGLYPLAVLGHTLNGYQVRGLENRETEAELLVRTVAGDPHTFTAQLGGLTALMTAGVERPVLGLSATAYFPQAVEEHLHAPVKWWIPDTRPKSIVTEPCPVRYTGGRRDGEAISVGGIHSDAKPQTLRVLGKNLYQQVLADRLAFLEETEHTRARCILAVNSYQQAAYLASGLAQAEGLRHRVCVVVRGRRPEDYEQHIPSFVRKMVREELERFPDHGEILIVPLAIIARGLNILVESRSAVRDIYLCTRPVLSIEDIEWMHGSVNAAGINALPEGGSSTPVTALRQAEAASRQQITRILRSPSRFTNMAHELQEELVAGMLIDLVQLAGRARRGDTDMNLYIVDHALHRTEFSADLATIIRRIHGIWTPQQRAFMNELYGEALSSFLSYAGINPAQT